MKKPYQINKIIRIFQNFWNSSIGKLAESLKVVGGVGSITRRPHLGLVLGGQGQVVLVAAAELSVSREQFSIEKLEDERVGRVRVQHVVQARLERGGSVFNSATRKFDQGSGENNKF